MSVPLHRRERMMDSRRTKNRRSRCLVPLYVCCLAVACKPDSSSVQSVGDGPECSVGRGLAAEQVYSAFKASYVSVLHASNLPAERDYATKLCEFEAWINVLLTRRLLEGRTSRELFLALGRPQPDEPPLDPTGRDHSRPWSVTSADYWIWAVRGPREEQLTGLGVAFDGSGRARSGRVFQKGEEGGPPTGDADRWISSQMPSEPPAEN